MKSNKLPKILRTEILLRLETWTLYAPFEVASTVVSKKENSRMYDLIRNNVGTMALRRGDIKSNPNNAVLCPKTLKPLTRVNEKGLKEVVIEGHFNAWFGFTWKKQITDEELQDYYEARYCTEQDLVMVLKNILAKKENPEPKPAPVKRARHKKGTRKRIWIIIAVVALFAFLVYSLGDSNPDLPLSDILDINEAPP